MYLEGRLSSGHLMSGTIQGDVEVTGEQVSCGSCHRRSGMGSTEGQQVIPAITGKILFSPLQLPASKPPETPILRLAYTRETLKRAIRNGIDANGRVLDPNMPRYPLNDDNMDRLIDYLDTLSQEFSPGVDEHNIHFATIISDSIAETKKKALLDVMRAFFQQKNVETRHETERAENAPWHKEWIFKPYRKWVLHEWELKGPPDTWPEQLAEFYQKTPVFSVITGVVAGTWEPIHQFCEVNKIPCLFPTTDLPVIVEGDFYSIYMNRGMTLEGEGIASHIVDDPLTNNKIIQVYDENDVLGKTAADGLRAFLSNKSGQEIDDLAWSAGSNGRYNSLPLPKDSILVCWGDEELLNDILSRIEDVQSIRRIYLSTTLFGVNIDKISDKYRDITYFVNSQEMPDKLARLILRSTGWLKAKRIYSPGEKRIQANAYFALKVAGGALRLIRGYFYRDYFVERIEHLIDNAPYTSVYPHIGLAPGQRFVSKGFYIAKLSGEKGNSLKNVTKWSIP